MINQLGLFLDTNGLIRSKGRVGNSELEESACHPLLLSPKEYLTRLIVLKCHIDCMHGGVNQTLNQVRQEFWIPKGRQCVKSFEFLCSLQENGGEDLCVPRAPTSARRKGQVFCVVSNCGGRL